MSVAESQKFELEVTTYIQINYLKIDLPDVNRQVEINQTSKNSRRRKIGEGARIS